MSRDKTVRVSAHQLKERAEIVGWLEALAEVSTSTELRVVLYRLAVEIRSGAHRLGSRRVSGE
jgi:hypothetical protein